MIFTAPLLRPIIHVAFLTVISLGPAHGAIGVFPTNPRSLETVRVQVEAGGLNGQTSDVFDLAATDISMVGSKITVLVKNRGRGASLAEPSPALDIPIGQFPPGDYSVELRMESPGFTALIGASSFSVRPKTSLDRLSNLTDIWWSPQESGWGLNIAQHSSGTIFATWTLYDENGKATWYVAPGGQWLGNGVSYIAPLYKVTGPTFCFDNEPCLRPRFDPAAITQTIVGAVALQIIPGNYDELLATLTLEGKSVTRFMRRLSF